MIAELTVSGPLWPVKMVGPSRDIKNNTFSVPSFSYDKNGHILSAQNRTVKVNPSHMGTTNTSGKRYLMGSVNQTNTSGGVNTNKDVYTEKGRVYSKGFCISSSIKLKEGIKDYTNDATSILNGVKVVDYNYIGDETPKVGFIAEWTDPLLSTPDQNGVDTGNCIGLLIKAVQELSERLDNLEIRLNTL